MAILLPFLTYMSEVDMALKRAACLAELRVALSVLHLFSPTPSGLSLACSALSCLLPPSRPLTYPAEFGAGAHSCCVRHPPHRRWHFSSLAGCAGERWIIDGGGITSLLRTVALPTLHAQRSTDLVQLC